MPTLLILAAGMGSRYGGLKQLDPVGPSGEVVIDYSMYDALRSGFDHFVFVIRPELEEDFRAQIGSRVEGRARVSYVYQELADLPDGFSVPPGRSKPWGTGHAVLAARPVIDEPFAVVNADDFYGQSSYKQLASFLAKPPSGKVPAYALVGFRLRNTLSDFDSVSRGICRCDEQGLLEQVVEFTSIERNGEGAVQTHPDGRREALSGDEWVSMNMWGFTPSIFEHLARQFNRFLRERGSEPKAEFYLPGVVDDLVAAKRATAQLLPCPVTWFGVTYPEDKPVVAQSIQKLVDAGEYPDRLWTHHGA